MTVATERFTHGGREWIAEPCETEKKDRYFWRIRPAVKGWPFPSAEEHRAARVAFFANRPDINVS